MPAPTTIRHYGGERVCPASSDTTIFLDHGGMPLSCRVIDEAHCIQSSKRFDGKNAKRLLLCAAISLVCGTGCLLLWVGNIASCGRGSLGFFGHAATGRQ